MASKANEGFTRVDLEEIDANREEKVRFSKVQGRLIKDARQAAQPPICLICGKPLEKPCNSHTVPQYCLREIAVDGKVLSLAVLLDIFRESHRKCVRDRENTELHGHLP